LLAHFERNPTEVERAASDLIELCTRQTFASWLPGGVILRGWARSAAGDPAAGISRIEDGIREYQETGAILRLPYFLALQAEVLHHAGRTHEALLAISKAKAMAAKTEGRWWCAEMCRLRAVFLVEIGANETEIETSFCEAIRISKGQKSTSLTARAEASYLEYRRQKESSRA
jgi:predicted ATPase